MKKPVKLVLWGLGIVLGLLFIAAVLFYINFRHATKAMTPAETGSLNDSVWCIKDRFVNAYIFKGTKSYLMVDAGIGESNFKKELDKTGIEPDKITTLLLTHTDGDHIGATGLFKNAMIYMHKDEKQMIDGTTGKTRLSKTIWRFGPYKLLSNNDILSIDGLRIRIIHTPGHTPGSSCYIIGNDYLVTGDNLIFSNGKYEHFLERFNMNTPEEIESIKKLPDPTTFRFILTGHNGVTRIR
jgi:glyoxylase-like metal-dependent hydrolase (beta-lactamase superfamily II)